MEKRGEDGGGKLDGDGMCGLKTLNGGTLGRWRREVEGKMEEWKN